MSDPIRLRRSIRKYKQGEIIQDEHLHSILEAAMLAPSACNTRPWEFVVVKNQELREKIAKLQPYAAHAVQAAAVIVVVGLPKAQDKLASGFWPQDCAAATENILLEAARLGYGTCWCGLYPREPRAKKMGALLGIDEEKMPFSIITLGVPDEAPAMRGKYEEKRVTIIE